MSHILFTLFTGIEIVHQSREGKVKGVKGYKVAYHVEFALHTIHTLHGVKGCEGFVKGLRFQLAAFLKVIYLIAPGIPAGSLGAGKKLDVGSVDQPLDALAGGLWFA